MPYLLIFEVIVFGLFFGCLWNARRQSTFAVYRLLWTVIYGFLLEWLTLHQLQAYQYGDYIVMIDGAPLSVALGWGAIIYTAMSFSDRVDLPEWMRPLLDALLALNIDLALDALAIRSGLWEWTGVALHEEWFGVPWANFWAWFLVVSSFSMALRWLAAWQMDKLRRWFLPPAAMLLSLLALLTASELYRFIAPQSNQALPTGFLLAGSLLIILNARPKRLPTVHKPSRIIALVPLGYHAYSIYAGLTLGVFITQPLLGVIAVMMLIMSLLLHRWVWIAHV